MAADALDRATGRALLGLARLTVRLVVVLVGLAVLWLSGLELFPHRRRPRRYARRVHVAGRLLLTAVGVALLWTPVPAAVTVAVVAAAVGVAAVGNRMRLRVRDRVVLANAGPRRPAGRRPVAAARGAAQPTSTGRAGGA